MESPSLDDIHIISPTEAHSPSPDDDDTDFSLPPSTKAGDHTALGTMSKLLKGKEKEWACTVNKTPLRLLDLPVDILKEIIHQVSSYLPLPWKGWWVLTI